MCPKAGSNMGAEDGISLVDADTFDERATAATR
jgi:hypothetical protein